MQWDVTSVWLKWSVNKYDIVVPYIASCSIVLVKHVIFNDSESKYYESFLSACLLAPFINWLSFKQIKKRMT